MKSNVSTTVKEVQSAMSLLSSYKYEVRCLQKIWTKPWLYALPTLKETNKWRFLILIVRARTIVTFELAPVDCPMVMRWLQDIISDPHNSRTGGSKHKLEWLLRKPRDRRPPHGGHKPTEVMKNFRHKFYKTCNVRIKSHFDLTFDSFVRSAMPCTLLRIEK